MPSAAPVELHPDIIVTKLPMPGYDGRQFIQELKQSTGTLEIPVVALSDHHDAANRDQPEQIGFAAFLASHCLPGELSRALRQLLDKNTRVVG